MSEEPPTPGGTHPGPEHGQPPPVYAAYAAPTATQLMANQKTASVMAVEPEPFTSQSPGDTYKGFNACCCYTIDKGAKAVVKADIAMSTLSFVAWVGFLFLFQLEKASTPTIQALLIIVVILILLDLASLVFSVIIMKSLNNFKKSWMWPPMAWIGTAIFRTLMWIAFLAFWQPLLQPYENYTVLDGTLLFRADELFFGYLLHLIILMVLNGWFVFVMLGYMRYKKVNQIGRQKPIANSVVEATEENSMTPAKSQQGSQSQLKP